MRASKVNNNVILTHKAAGITLYTYIARLVFSQNLVISKLLLGK